MMNSIKNVLKVLLFIPMSCFAQNENINSGKYHPAKEFFETKYVKQDYSRFAKSQIKIYSNYITFADTKRIDFEADIDEKYKLILANGLLDPYKIYGSFIVKLCCFEELQLLSPNPQTRRFKFWIFPKDNIQPNNSEAGKFFSSTLNPKEYYFELQNEVATDKTSYEDFVNGAQLTFLSFGTIII